MSLRSKKNPLLGWWLPPKSVNVLTVAVARNAIFCPFVCDLIWKIYAFSLENLLFIFTLRYVSPRVHHETVILCRRFIIRIRTPNAHMCFWFDDVISRWASSWERQVKWYEIILCIYAMLSFSPPQVMIFLAIIHKRNLSASSLYFKDS